jgi:hypothetical protein
LRRYGGRRLKGERLTGRSGRPKAESSLASSFRVSPALQPIPCEPEAYASSFFSAFSLFPFSLLPPQMATFTERFMQQGRQEGVQRRPDLWHGPIGSRNYSHGPRSPALIPVKTIADIPPQGQGPAGHRKGCSVAAGAVSDRADSVIPLEGAGFRHPESDLDLLLLAKRALSWQERNSITDALFDIELEHDVVIAPSPYPARSGKKDPMRFSPGSPHP